MPVGHHTVTVALVLGEDDALVDVGLADGLVLGLAGLFCGAVGDETGEEEVLDLEEVQTGLALTDRDRPAFLLLLNQRPGPGLTKQTNLRQTEPDLPLILPLITDLLDHSDVILLGLVFGELLGL